MNNIFSVIAEELNITQYEDEPEESYGYRIIYSAIGHWCLRLSLKSDEGEKGITKKTQTIMLHKLLDMYIQMCPLTKRFLLNAGNLDIVLHIRNLYEQMGYLSTLENNRNVLNQTGETLRITDRDYIFLGIPETSYKYDGLGIHTVEQGKELELSEYLVRDKLSSEEYLLSCFDLCDFEEKEILLSELEFFNPFYRGKMSEAWEKKPHSDMTLARKSTIGPFFRVMRNEEEKLVYSDENNDESVDSKYGREYRRLYVALKKYYLVPMRVIICPIDNKYSQIRILGNLPNREYYYILLNAWPQKSFSDRYNFIIRNELITQVVGVLKNIGFEEGEGKFNG